MASIKKKSLVDQVYESIRWDIISLNYTLGSRLKLSELQEVYGVSATPIREALNRLSQEGLVQFETNVGVRILSLNEHDIMEIEELAMTLHSASIRLAIQRTDHAVLAGLLRMHLEEYRKASSVQDQVFAIHHFVGTFYMNCGNARLDRNMISIQGQQLLLRFIYAQYGDGKETNLTDLQEITEAVAAGDAGKAAGILERNTHRADPVLLRYVAGA